MGVRPAFCVGSTALRYSNFGETLLIVTNIWRNLYLPKHIDSNTAQRYHEVIRLERNSVDLNTSEKEYPE